MKRWLPLAALVAAAALMGCAGGGDDAAGVGAGPGPATPRSSLAADDSPAQQRVSRVAGSASSAAAPSDEGPLPGGDFFDGSAKAFGGPRFVRAGYAPSRGAERTRAERDEAALRYALSRPRRLSADDADVPAPGSLPAVELPRAEPSKWTRGGGPVLQAFEAFQRETYETALPVLSRLAWRARAPREAEVAIHPTHVTVHHTDGHPRTKLSDSIEEIRGIQAFHQGPERGWADIGYHFVIDGSGRVFEGRHADVLGAHARGANLDNIGVALMGDYNRDQLSEGQKTALRRLITFLALRYRADPSRRGFIQPHMHYGNTDCPGKNVVAFLETLRREVDGDTQALVAGGAPAGAAPSFVPLALVQ